jgi:cytochrome c oxidase cbb3-type subunit 4
MFATIHAWWTVLLMAVFIGIVVWAYSGARKKDFDEAARLALDDDGDELVRPDSATARGKGDANG